MRNGRANPARSEEIAIENRLKYTATLTLTAAVSLAAYKAFATAPLWGTGLVLSGPIGWGILAVVGTVLLIALPIILVVNRDAAESKLELAKRWTVGRAGSFVLSLPTLLSTIVNVGIAMKNAAVDGDFNRAGKRMGLARNCFFSSLILLAETISAPSVESYTIPNQLVAKGNIFAKTAFSSRAHNLLKTFSPLEDKAEDSSSSCSEDSASYGEDRVYRSPSFEDLFQSV